MTAPSFRLHKKYQLRIAYSRASTSFTTASGIRSSRLPLRAPISMVLGWSQRITPVVFVPAPSSETVKPASRAKFPPLVTGTTTGNRVNVLNDAFDTMSTGRFPLCSWPVVGPVKRARFLLCPSTGSPCPPQAHQSIPDPLRLFQRADRTAPTVLRANSGDVFEVQ